MPTPTRPEHKINGSDLHVTVPPGWFVTIASISRESYNQVISITDDVYGEPNTAYIGSKYSKPPTAMKDLRSRNDSTAITAQGKQILLDLSFYYTTDKSLSKDLQKVATPNYRSHSIDILQVDKPDTAPATIPDYTMLMIFIEDTKDQKNADHGMYDDAVATIHLVKKAVKPNADADDSDSD